MVAFPYCPCSLLWEVCGLRNLCCCGSLGKQQGFRTGRVLSSFADSSASDLSGFSHCAWPLSFLCVLNYVHPFSFLWIDWFSCYCILCIPLQSPVQQVCSPFHFSSTSQSFLLHISSPSLHSRSFHSTSIMNLQHCHITTPNPCG